MLRKVFDGFRNAIDKVKGKFIPKPDGQLYDGTSISLDTKTGKVTVDDKDVTVSSSTVRDPKEEKKAEERRRWWQWGRRKSRAVRGLYKTIGFGCCTKWDLEVYELMRKGCLLGTRRAKKQLAAQKRAEMKV